MTEKIKSIAEKCHNIINDERKYHHCGSYISEEYEELEGIFSVIEETALSCENCHFYKCKRYSEEAPKKLKAMQNALNILEEFKKGNNSLAITKMLLDAEYKPMKSCTKERDSDIVLGIKPNDDDDDDDEDDLK